MFHSKDRGCTAPGCTVSGYLCEVHVTDYATCHTTDINDLTFACGPYHRMLQPGGWTTKKNTHGDTEWKHHPTSTADQHAPTPSTTPKNCWATGMMTTRGNSLGNLNYG